MECARLLMFLAGLLSFVNGKYPVNMVWPRPSEVSFGVESLCLKSSAWKFQVKGKCEKILSQTRSSFILEDSPESFQSTKQQSACQDLAEALDRYQKLLFNQHVAVDGSISRCINTATVQVEDIDAVLDFGVDESYELEVSQDGIQINAKTVFGAYHGLESLSQLVRFSFPQKIFTIENAPWKIVDAPRFSHRELLIDSSRHYLPLRTLELVIDSMTFSKGNVLHWHLEDQQSFPICSQRFPKLCESAAYASTEKYSVEDIKYIVEYARKRGVRIMPELDIPGHTAAICRGYPEACVAARNMITPARNMSKEIIKGLLEEWTGIFPDSFVHLGGDEVDTRIWEADPQTVRWLAKNSMSSKDAFLWIVEFTNRVAVDLGKIPVGWSDLWELFRTKLNSKSVMEKYRDQDDEVDITAENYRVIYANGKYWYLDHLGIRWETMYTVEPCVNLTSDRCKLIIGGGGEMWGETVDTGDILNTVWPRHGAVLERLWSPKEVNDVAQARGRLFQFRCHLHRRGIPAGPLLLNGRASPPGPGSCYGQ